MTLVNSRSVGFFVARKFDDRHVTCQNAGGYPRILYAVVCYYFSIIIINIIVNYQSIGAIIIIIKHLVCEILKDIVRTRIFAMCAIISRSCYNLD